MWRWFDQLRRATGLDRETLGRQARLHDVRHTFVLRTLLGWYREANDVEAQLPLLATVLGHVHPTDTSGISRARRSCSRWPPSGSSEPGRTSLQSPERAAHRRSSATRCDHPAASQGVADERARAAAAGVFRRPSRPPARRQPAHDRLLSRQLPAAARRSSTSRPGKAPSKLQLEDLDPTRITAFLSYLENERGNSARTRNARLTAIHSFFHYAALKAPECAEQIARVLSIPEKRYESTLISYLTEPEIDALLAAPDRSTLTGRRDHALLLLAVQTGLRASELASLRCQDLNLDQRLGQVRRQRQKGKMHATDPRHRQVLRVWLRELDSDPAGPLFPAAAAVT